MEKITLVTGNPNKLKEYQALLPEHSAFEFTSHSLDIPEIQSLNLEEIVRNKLLHAYESLKTPVVVEDISAELQSLEGLPGPFIKFFEQKLGADALYKLSKQDADPVTIKCTIGYYDGQEFVFGEGILNGKIVKPAGDNGFGFDMVIIPNGESRTVAQMDIQEKNKISHRYLALQSLIGQLQNKF